MSLEVMKSELDLFKKVSFQGAIEDSQLIQFRPTSALSATSDIEFNINISSGEYLDLQNVYLWVKGKLTKQDNTEYVAADDNKYSLINYGLNTIFDQLDVYLSGTLVSQSSKTYPYLAQIEALTQISANSGHSYMKSAGFESTFLDPTYDFDTIDTDLHAKVKRSRIFSLYGRMHGSIFNSDKLLLNGIPIRIILSRASNTFCTMGTAAVAAGAGVVAAPAVEPKLHLTDVSLFVRKVKLSPNLLNAHARALQIEKAIYPIKRSLIKVLNLPAQQSTYFIDNVFMGQMPCRMIIGLVSNDAYSGSHFSNPFKFANNDLTFLAVHMNGESFPKTPYQPDYRADSIDFSREYFDFLMNLGATKAISQPPVDYINYPKGHCLYAFNFNSDFENPNENEYINIPKEGFLNIEIKFRANLANALKLIVYAQFDNIIEIDENRNVTVDFS